MTRAATIRELQQFAAHGQWSKVYAHVCEQVTVFSALVNQSAPPLDNLFSLDYDTVSVGAYTDIEIGMTVYVHSPAGILRGVGYIRKAADTVSVYIGKTSNISAADNDVITVVRDWSVWCKKPSSISDGTLFLDSNVEYSNQLSVTKPLILAGGDRALKLVGASVSAVYALGGCASYVTTCAGATVTDSTTDTPSISFDAAGEYWVKIVGTGSTGAVSTTWRMVCVYTRAAPPQAVTLDDNGADETGWGSKITMYSAIAPRPFARVLIFADDHYIANDVQTIKISGAVTGGALTLTYRGASGNVAWSSNNTTLIGNIQAALDGMTTIGAGNSAAAAGSLTAGIGTITVTFGGTLNTPNLPLMDWSSSLTGTGATVRVYPSGASGSIGSLTGCENIIMSGWVIGNTLTIDDISGGASFEIGGADYFLSIAENPSEIKLVNTGVTPTAWGEAETLTAQFALWYALEWFSTAPLCVDCIGFVNSTASAEIVAQPGPVLSQLAEIADKVKASVFCDQFGRLLGIIDTPLIPIADRAAIPSVGEIAISGCENIDVEIVQTNPCSQYLTTSILANGDVIASIGGGHTPGEHGSIANEDNLLAPDQETANVLAGSLFSRENCPYRFSFTNLRGNIRLVEPYDRVTVALTGSDNLQGVVYSGYAIVRSVSRTHDPDTGAWSIDFEADAETQADRYCTGDIPVPPTDPEIDPLIVAPFPKLPPLPRPRPPRPPKPSEVTTTASECYTDAPENGPFYLLWDRAWIDGSPIPANRHAFAWKRCTIREAGADNPTSIVLRGCTFYGLPYDHIAVYGIDSAKNRLATGAVTKSNFYENYVDITITFSEVSAIAVDGFELEMEEGYDYTTAGITVFSHSFSKFTFYGHQYSLTDTLVNYNPAGGNVEYLEYVSGRGFFTEALWRSETYIVLPAGSIGTLYLSIFAETTNEGDVPGQEPIIKINEYGTVPEIFVKQGSFSGLYKMRKYTVGASPYAADMICDISSYWGDFTARVSLRWIYAGVIPQRTLFITRGEMYNVCPVVE